MLAKTMFCKHGQTFFFVNTDFVSFLWLSLTANHCRFVLLLYCLVQGRTCSLNFLMCTPKNASPPPLYRQSPGGWSRGRSPRKVISINVLCRLKSTLCLCARSTITCFVSVTRCMDSISGLVEWLIFSCLIFFK